MHEVYALMEKDPQMKKRVDEMVTIVKHCFEEGFLMTLEAAACLRNILRDLCFDFVAVNIDQKWFGHHVVYTHEDHTLRAYENPDSTEVLKELSIEKAIEDYAQDILSHKAENRQAAGDTDDGNVVQGLLDELDETLEQLEQLKASLGGSKGTSSIEKFIALVHEEIFDGKSPQTSVASMIAEAVKANGFTPSIVEKALVKWAEDHGRLKRIHYGPIKGDRMDSLMYVGDVVK